MANRFLDTNYYKSPFVRSLKGPLKSLYSFIICDCDGAGIWNFDLQAAEMYIGFAITKEEFQEAFEKTGKAISLGGGKFFFPDFIEHQYPSGLQANNKAHKNFISTLTKYGLIDSDQKIIKKEAPLEEPLKGSHVQSRSSNGNGLGTGNGLGHVEGGSGEEKFIVPQMCKVWYETFPTYTADKENDYDGMGKILGFIARQAHLKQVHDSDTQVKILNTLQLIADQVNREPFWVNKPIKSIAHSIQEFYNKIKNPVNGTSSKSGVSGSSTSKEQFRTDVQAELSERFKKRRQSSG